MELLAISTVRPLHCVFRAVAADAAKIRHSTPTIPASNSLFFMALCLLLFSMTFKRCLSQNHLFSLLLSQGQPGTEHIPRLTLSLASSVAGHVLPIPKLLRDKLPHSIIIPVKSHYLHQGLCPDRVFNQIF